MLQGFCPVKADKSWVNYPAKVKPASSDAGFLAQVGARERRFNGMPSKVTVIFEMTVT